MIIFGVYNTLSINRFLKHLREHLKSNHGIDSVFFSWNLEAYKELKSLGTDSTYFLNPGVILLDEPIPNRSYVSRLTAKTYDLDWIIEIEKHLSYHGLNREGLLRKAVCCIDLYESIVARLNPKLFVLWNGEHLCNRILRAIAKHCGIQVVYIERGPLPDTIFFDPDGTNASSSVTTCKFDMPEKQATQWARDRVQDYITSDESTWEQPGILSEELFKQKIGVPPNKKLVLLPLQVDEDTNQIMHSPIFPSSAELINAVLPIYAKQPDIHLIIKPHPKEPKPVSQDIIEKYPFCSLHSDLHVKQILMSCHHVITNNSTIGIESILFGKPVIQTGNSYYGNKGLTLQLDNREDLENKINTVVKITDKQSQLTEKGIKFIASLYEQGHIFDTRRCTDVPLMISKILSHYQKGKSAKILEVNHEVYLSNTMNIYNQIYALEQYEHYLKTIDQSQIGKVFDLISSVPAFKRLSRVLKLSRRQRTSPMGFDD